MITMLTSKCTLASGAGGSTPRRRGQAAPVIVSVLDLLSTWFERARQRRHLHALDDRMLKDIGLTRADVEFEAQKHFWRG